MTKTLVVQPDTYNRLLALKRGNDTFDTVIKRLLNQKGAD